MEDCSYYIVDNIEPLSKCKIDNVVELLLFKNKINSIDILSECIFNNLKSNKYFFNYIFN